MASPFSRAVQMLSYNIKDVVYDSLFSESSEEFDNLTNLALQQICKAMHPMLCRQLKDQLPGGKYHLPTEELIQQTASAPLTNKISEADFSDLDRIERNAPQKGKAAKSGLICFTRNKTSIFLQKLSTHTKKKYLNIARKSAIQRMNADRIRTQLIRRKRQQMQKQRMEVKHDREAKRAIAYGKLQERMKDVGIWVTEQEVKSKIAAMKKLKEKITRVKEQIKFHVQILKTPLSDDYLGKFQRGKHMFTIDELTNNLIRIIEPFSTVVPETVLLVNSAVQAVDAQQRPSTSRKSQSHPRSGKPAKKKRKHHDQQTAELPAPNNSNLITLEEGEMYAVAFEDHWYPGVVTKKIGEDEAMFSFMKRCGSAFQWPATKDVHPAHVQGVLVKITLIPTAGGRQWRVEDMATIDQLYESN